MLRTALSNTKSLPSDPTSLLPADFTWGAFERVLGLCTQAEAIAEGGSGAVGQLLALPAQLGDRRRDGRPSGQVFFSAMAAYAFARLRWPGRDMRLRRSSSRR